MHFFSLFSFFLSFFFSPLFFRRHTRYGWTSVTRSKTIDVRGARKFNERGGGFIIIELRRSSFVARVWRDCIRMFSQRWAPIFFFLYQFDLTRELLWLSIGERWTGLMIFGNCKGQNEGRILLLELLMRFIIELIYRCSVILLRSLILLIVEVSVVRFFENE